MTQTPPISAEQVEDAKRALGLLADEDARNDKLHDLLETIREQIRLEIKPEHRPEGLMTNIQGAVYAMRGRLRIMDDTAIVGPLNAAASIPAGRGVETEVEMKWRELALQFDAHRMEALGLLRALDKVATSPDLSRLSADIRAFLSAPPLSGEAVLAKRIAALAALPAPLPVEEQEPFATAWQTSYTGDQWHFDRKVSFAPADIERGIVRNITPLAALVKP